MVKAIPLVGFLVLAFAAFVLLVPSASATDPAEFGFPAEIHCPVPGQMTFNENLGGITAMTPPNVASAAWDFGDGSAIETHQPPVHEVPHSYATTGQVTAALTVTDATGTHSKSRTLCGDMTNNNRKVLHEPKAYLIFWGDWDGAATGDPDHDKDLYTDLFEGVGGSAWFETMTQYEGTDRDASHSPPNNGAIQNSVDQYGGSVVDNSCNALPSGLVATKNDHFAPVVKYWAQSGASCMAGVNRFGYDPDGVYVIFIPHDQRVESYGISCLPGEDCGCAYHDKVTSSAGNVIPFIVMPYQRDANGCKTVAPTGLVSHVYAEAVTRPEVDVDGWADSNGAENGDKCQWTYNYEGEFPNHPTTTVQSHWSNLSHACRPWNDEMESATVIPSLPYDTDPLNPAATYGAREETGEALSCAGEEMVSTVWFKYDATTDGSITIATDLGTGWTNWDRQVAAYQLAATPASLPNLSRITCFVATLSTSLPVVVVAGETYYFQVGGVHCGGCATEVGKFKLHVTYGGIEPWNDDFADAWDLSLTSPYGPPNYPIAESTYGATMQIDEPLPCDHFPGDRSIWFKYVPGLTGIVTVDLRGSEDYPGYPGHFDPIIQFYTGLTLSSLAPWPSSCHDDLLSLHAVANVEVFADQTYYIQVTGWDFNSVPPFGIVHLSLAIHPQRDCAPYQPIGGDAPDAPATNPQIPLVVTCESDLQIGDVDDWYRFENDPSIGDTIKATLIADYADFDLCIVSTPPISPSPAPPEADPWRPVCSEDGAELEDTVTTGGQGGPWYMHVFSPYGKDPAAHSGHYQVFVETCVRGPTSCLT
ncbi:MAG: hypothetical protein LC620_00125 [Halobacteriales archaeon]|nr:hypothetical protein [Halobacteriales archaeon]